MVNCHFLLAHNGQICDAAHSAFERVGEGIAYFMLASGGYLYLF